MARYTPVYSREALDDDFAVIHNGMCLTYLNSRLFYKNGLSENDLATIKKLHCDMYVVYCAMEATDDIVELKRLAGDVEQLEFALQKAWKFHVSSKWHHWFDVPKCTCPKYDNIERLGTKERIFNSECTIHGVVNEKP